MDRGEDRRRRVHERRHASVCITHRTRYEFVNVAIVRRGIRVNRSTLCSIPKQLSVSYRSNRERYGKADSRGLGSFYVNEES